jgi:hypothetical protein
MQPGIATGHGIPQAPQFIGSVMVSEQVPSQLILPSAGHGS